MPGPCPVRPAGANARPQPPSGPPRSAGAAALERAGRPADHVGEPAAPQRQAVPGAQPVVLGTVRVEVPEGAALAPALELLGATAVARRERPADGVVRVVALDGVGE